MTDEPIDSEAAAPGRFPLRAVVAYEDTASRNRALRLCRRLVEQFGDDIELEFSWWKFEFLADFTLARKAARAARWADLILVSARARRELPRCVELWIERWLHRRINAEGLLGALIGPLDESGAGTCPIYNYLREVSRRASMEYLPELTPALAEGTNCSAEAIRARADQTTSTLETILHPGKPQPDSRA